VFPAEFALRVGGIRGGADANLGIGEATESQRSKDRDTDGERSGSVPSHCEI
jgi:hypothetical protein